MRISGCFICQVFGVLLNLIKLSEFLPLDQFENIIFVIQPQNYNDTSQPISLICSTNVHPPNGFDWNGYFPAEMKVCETINVRTREFRCEKGYNVTQPDNQTTILHIDPRIIRLADRYCCQYDDGQGPKSCANRSISSEPTEAMTFTTTAVPGFDITSGSNESSGSSHFVTAIVVVIIVCVIFGAVIGAFVWYKKCRRTSEKGRECSRADGNRATGSPHNESVPLNNETQQTGPLET